MPLGHPFVEVELADGRATGRFREIEIVSNVNDHDVTLSIGETYDTWVLLTSGLKRGKL